MLSIPRFIVRSLSKKENILLKTRKEQTTPFFSTEFQPLPTFYEQWRKFGFFFGSDSDEKEVKEDVSKPVIPGNLPETMDKSSSSIKNVLGIGVDHPIFPIKVPKVVRLSPTLFQTLNKYDLEKTPVHLGLFLKKDRSKLAVESMSDLFSIGTFARVSSLTPHPTNEENDINNNGENEGDEAKEVGGVALVMPQRRVSIEEWIEDGPPPKIRLVDFCYLLHLPSHFYYLIIHLIIHLIIQQYMK